MKTCPHCHKKHRFFQWLFRRKCDPKPREYRSSATLLDGSKIKVQDDSDDSVVFPLFIPIPDSPIVQLATPYDDPIASLTERYAVSNPDPPLIALETGGASESVILESPEPPSTLDPSPSYDSPSYDTGSGSDSSGSFDSPSSDSSGLA